MRKIRILEHSSLDGVIEQEDGYVYGSWTTPYRSPTGLQLVLEAQGVTFDLLLGRRTYDLWAGHWPNAGDSLIAHRINAATKYVVTHRPESLRWGPAQGVGPDFVAALRDLKASAGPDVLVWGSSTITPLLLDSGLADEVVLLVYPVLLGEGKRLLSGRVAARELAFVSSRATATGVLVNTYRHVGALRAQ